MKKSSTVALLLSTTRDAVSKKFGSGVILRAKISNISTAMFLFIVFPFCNRTQKHHFTVEKNMQGFFFLREVEDIRERESKKTKKDQVNK